MKANNGKNLASKIESRLKDTISKHQAMNNSLATVRNLRTGWRNTGALQYVRYYSTEGVYTVGLGGPPVVGR